MIREQEGGFQFSSGKLNGSFISFYSGSAMVGVHKRESDEKGETDKERGCENT